jgi:hypothetical protein
MTFEGAHGKTVDEVNRLIPPKLSVPVSNNSVHAMEGTNHGSKGTESALGEHFMLRITASRAIPYPNLKYGLSSNVSS